MKIYIWDNLRTIMGSNQLFLFKAKILQGHNKNYRGALWMQLCLREYPMIIGMPFIYCNVWSSNAESAWNSRVDRRNFLIEEDEFLKTNESNSVTKYPVQTLEKALQIINIMKDEA